MKNSFESIKPIISNGEFQTIEFKQIWKDEYLKTICAFANTDGGFLYIGVDDDGIFLGLENTQNLLETLLNVKQFYYNRGVKKRS